MVASLAVHSVLARLRDRVGIWSTYKLVMLTRIQRLMGHDGRHPLIVKQARGWRVGILIYSGSSGCDAGLKAVCLSI